MSDGALPASTKSPSQQCNPEVVGEIAAQSIHDESSALYDKAVAEHIRLVTEAINMIDRVQERLYEAGSVLSACDGTYLVTPAITRAAAGDFGIVAHRLIRALRVGASVDKLSARVGSHDACSVDAVSDPAPY